MSQDSFVPCPLRNKCPHSKGGKIPRHKKNSTVYQEHCRMSNGAHSGNQHDNSQSRRSDQYDWSRFDDTKPQRSVHDNGKVSDHQSDMMKYHFGPMVDEFVRELPAKNISRIEVDEDTISIKKGKNYTMQITKDANGGFLCTTYENGALKSSEKFDDEKSLIKYVDDELNAEKDNQHNRYNRRKRSDNSGGASNGFLARLLSRIPILPGNARF